MMRALATVPHRISPKHFYDATGSALFDQICQLPEYYPTRTELNILTTHAQDIALAIGPNSEIIEFGAGSLSKIRLLLDSLIPGNPPRKYLPLDISGSHLEGSAQSLRTHYPGLTIEPMIADYTMPLTLPAPLSGSKRVGFFPGSTIGNFEPNEAQAFLQNTARLLHGGALLIGVDLYKSPQILHRAYNDQSGVTAAFNLNLLRRANTELGTDFDLEAFAHYAFFNPRASRIEMHLLSQRHQVVHLDDKRFELAEGASIHTENSYKYTIETFQELAHQAGFRTAQVWTDKKRFFSLYWLEAPKV